MMLPATIIAIEGPDRVGKQTQSIKLAEKLKSDGYKVKLFEVPIKSPISYRVIYWMLRNGLAKSLPNVFQFVQFLNKLFFQFKLFWIRWTCSYVIFDRWLLSAIVYGEAGGANKLFNRFLCSFLRDPDATIILMGAAKASEATDVYESDNSLQTRVRKGYAQWFLDNQKSVALVDNIGTREEVHDRVMRALEDKFNVL